MKKLKLNLKDLKVKSFETTKKGKKAKGTVVAYITAIWDPRCPQTVEAGSCNNTICA